MDFFHPQRRRICVRDVESADLGGDLAPERGGTSDLCVETAETSRKLAETGDVGRKVAISRRMGAFKAGSDGKEPHPASGIAPLAEKRASAAHRDRRPAEDGPHRSGHVCVKEGGDGTCE